MVEDKVAYSYVALVTLESSLVSSTEGSTHVEVTHLGFTFLTEIQCLGKKRSNPVPKLDFVLGAFLPVLRGALASIALNTTALSGHTLFQPFKFYQLYYHHKDKIVTASFSLRTADVRPLVFRLDFKTLDLMVKCTKYSMKLKSKSEFVHMWPAFDWSLLLPWLSCIDFREFKNRQLICNSVHSLVGHFERDEWFDEKTLRADLEFLKNNSV